MIEPVIVSWQYLNGARDTLRHYAIPNAKGVLRTLCGFKVPYIYRRWYAAPEPCTKCLAALNRRPS